MLFPALLNINERLSFIVNLDVYTSAAHLVKDNFVLGLTFNTFLPFRRADDLLSRVAISCRKINR